MNLEPDDQSPADALGDWHWRGLVPTRFHGVCGFRQHTFRTLLPNWSPPLRRVDGKNALRIGVARDGRIDVVSVERVFQPVVYDALVMIASVDGESDREHRYVTLFSVYESLVADRDIDATAIRHALAHAPYALRDPKVVTSLRRRFDGMRIDCREYRHQKAFFCSLALIICSIDREIAWRLQVDQS